MKHLFWFIPILCLLGWGQMRGPDGFRGECLLRGIGYPNPPQRMDPDELERRLSQRFTLLGSGTQAGALLGEDGETVFKFLLNGSLKGKRRMARPSRHRAARVAMRRAEGEKVLARYAAAFSLLNGELAILYTRLDPQEGPLPPLRVVCAGGVEREISLEGVPFWLQRKMEPVNERLQRVPDSREACRAALLDLLQRRAQKGFYDLRQGFVVGENYGFIGDRAYLIDAGRIGHSEALAQDPEEEVARLEKKLNRWFESRGPS